MKLQSINIWLPDDILEELQPLFEKAEACCQERDRLKQKGKEGLGMVLAQVKKSGRAHVFFVPPGLALRIYDEVNQFSEEK